jgi:hypothetical protein
MRFLSLGPSTECAESVPLERVHMARPHGARSETRTRDLNLGKVALYQPELIPRRSKKKPTSGLLFDLVAWGGIEPPTRGFSIRCSTN